MIYLGMLLVFIGGFLIGSSKDSAGNFDQAQLVTGFFSIGAGVYFCLS